MKRICCECEKPVELYEAVLAMLLMDKEVWEPGGCPHTNDDVHSHVDAGHATWEDDDVEFINLLKRLGGGYGYREPGDKTGPILYTHVKCEEVVRNAENAPPRA